MTPNKKLEMWRASARGLPQRIWSIIGPSMCQPYKVNLTEGSLYSYGQGETEDEAVDNAIQNFEQLGEIRDTYRKIRDVATI